MATNINATKHNTLPVLYNINSSTVILLQHQYIPLISKNNIIPGRNGGSGREALTEEIILREIVEFVGPANCMQTVNIKSRRIAHNVSSIYTDR